MRKWTGRSGWSGSDNASAGRGALTLRNNPELGPLPSIGGCGLPDSSDRNVALRWIAAPHTAALWGCPGDRPGTAGKSRPRAPGEWQGEHMTDTSIAALGRLTPVAPRDVWPHEAQHFTPWLLNNVDVLSDLLGMDLALDVAEHPVGGFSLDLMGRDETTGEVVIVENQLEISDHTHLGQILTYAAGTDATAIVWVAASFRPEHRAALDWLNARTDEDTRFFGVELGVVRIGLSEPAPSFRLVAQPNDWEKTVRAATTQVEASGKQVLYRAFWTRWIEALRSERPQWSRATRAPRDSWFSTTTGVSGITFYTSFTKRGLSSELVFESPNASVNTARFDALLAHRQDLEAAYGHQLDWQSLPSRKATRVAEYLEEADVSIEDDWEHYLDWMLDRQTRLRNALGAIGGLPVPAGE